MTLSSDDQAIELSLQSKQSEVLLNLLECHVSVIQSLIFMQQNGIILAHASKKIAKTLGKSADETAQARAMEGNEGETAEKVRESFKDSSGITSEKNLKGKIINKKRKAFTPCNQSYNMKQEMFYVFSFTIFVCGLYRCVEGLQLFDIHVHFLLLPCLFIFFSKYLSSTVKGQYAF